MTSNDDNPELARISSDQDLLFPRSAWELCHDIKLNTWAASKLFDDGWLSFDPESTNSLSEQQECELRFVGSLVTGGLSPRLLPELLKDLKKPYIYEGRKIYYDWADKRWRLLPVPEDDIEALLDEWIEELANEKNTDALEAMQGEIETALKHLAS